LDGIASPWAELVIGGILFVVVVRVAAVLIDPIVGPIGESAENVPAESECVL
jgi:hypothetical protein